VKAFIQNAQCAPLPISRRALITSVASFSLPSISFGADTIRVGRSLPLSGPFAEYAKERQIGADLFFSATNKNGGVAGRLLDIITLDDAYSADRLKLNIQQLDEKDKVVALFGFLGPSVAANFGEIERRKIPLIAATTGPSLRNPIQNFIFPLRAGFAEETERIVKHAATIGYSRIVLIKQQGPLGDLGALGYSNALEKLNLKPVSISTIQVNGSDAVQVAQAIQNTKCDALLCAAGAVPLAALLKAIDKIGSRPSAFSFAAVNTSQLFAELGKSAAGITVTQIVPSPWSNKFSVAREYQQACQAAQIKPSFYGIEGYLEAKLLVTGLKQTSRASKLDRVGVHSTFDRLGTVDLGNFEVSYSPNQRTGSMYTELSIIKEDGTVRL
jgi:branched-chain amino acid transport system substrate-binding protein